MVCADCVRVVPPWERRLEDLSGRYHSHLVGNEGWQEIFVRHRDRSKFFSWGKVPVRVGTNANVGIAGRVSRGWSRSLGASLWTGTGAELEESPARAEKLG